MTRLAAGLLLLTTLAAGATRAEEGFVAPYVDTVREDVELILDLAEVGPGDYLIDLGSGDGRFVVAAARRGALAQGVELDADLVARGRANAAAAGVAERTAFVHGDIFEAEISQATVVTIYLFPEANIALRPKLLAELAPGTRLVSNSFHMGDWAPDRRAQGRTSGGALLWVIPADVAGVWDLELPGATRELVIEQRYQTITAELDGMTVEAATLAGDRVTLLAGNGDEHWALHGRTEDGILRGTLQIDDRGTERVVPWTAIRRRTAP